ncbi:MAG: (2Fe-2S)-binding protein [Verrucomicrobia bacterium]|nr:MAG: (2Fe-2S)-binding protein [Verrucomicrobiota bacterium]
MNTESAGEKGLGHGWIRRTWVVNGEEVSLSVPPLRRVLDILREELGLTGTKEGCGEGECGTCTILVDDRPVCSCLLVAAQVPDGSRILTIEGLSAMEEGRILEAAYVEAGAVQCGFCIPGMLMASYALLRRNGKPTDAEIREAIAGNICRCTGYVKIVEAIRLAAERIGRAPAGK